MQVYKNSEDLCFITSQLLFAVTYQNCTGKAMHNYLSVYTIWSSTEYHLHLLRDIARVGRVVRLPQAAQSKGPKNEYFKLNKLIVCD